VGENDEGHDHGGEKAERKPGEGAHGVRVRRGEAGGGGNHKEDVRKAEDIPEQDGPAVGLFKRQAREEERAEGGDNITPAGHLSEAPGKLAARVEIKEVNADESGEMKQQQRAEGKAGSPGAEAGGKGKGEEERRREADERGLGRRAADQGEQLGFADKQRDEEPARANQPRGATAGKQGNAAIHAATSHGNRAGGQARENWR